MHAHAYEHINTLVKYVYYFLYQTAVLAGNICMLHYLEIIFMLQALIAY